MVTIPPTSAGSTRDSGSVPGLGRSPGEGNGSHSSTLAWETPWTGERHRPRGAKRQTRLSDPARVCTSKCVRRVELKLGVLTTKLQ